MLRISRKTVCNLIFLLLLLLATLLSIAGSYSFLFLFRRSAESVRSPNQPPRRSLRTEAVILYSQARSCSSVLGEIFNQRSDVAYFYEPLHPYHASPCELELDDRLKLLEKLVNCRFDVNEHYFTAFNATDQISDYAGYMKRKACFDEDAKHRIFQFRDAEFCHLSKKQGCNYCQASVTVPGMAKHCRQSLIRAMKVLLICKLEWLVPLLSNQTVNLKVVHLFRDPRAIVNSKLRAMNPAYRLDAAQRQGHKVCSRMERNLILADNVIRKGPLKHQYMRIRHEDFAMRPVETTQAVYDFIGININPHVKRWLIKATSTDNDAGLSASQWQGTKRNALAVVSDWRKALSWGEVEEIQKHCAPSLRLLGYRVFGNEKEMRDVENMPSFTAGGD